MKTAIALIAGLLVATSQAATAGKPITYAGPFESRTIKSMPGKCTSDGHCKVPGGLHKGYNCYNSACLPTDIGKTCTIAEATDLGFVGKCPQNHLDYAWDWPWHTGNPTSKEDTSAGVVYPGN